MKTAVRLRIFAIAVFFAFFLIILRLLYWQTVKSSILADQVRFQHETGYVLTAKRGSILSSDRTHLVYDDEGWLIYASLNELSENPEDISKKLALLLVDDGNNKNAVSEEEKRLYSLLTKQDIVWSPLKHKVDNNTKNNIQALNISGIGWEEEDRRFYPEASSAAQLLGFVGKNEEGDDKGYFGLEGYYDLVLSGKPGFMEIENDVKGSPILLGNTKEIGAISGVDLLTSIDKAIQLTVDRELKKGIEKYGAKSGSVIIMDPKSGDILAMSSWPGYEPDKYWQYSNEYFLNPVISSSFEPGSVFKVVVMASALDAKVIDSDTKCDICSGPLKIDKYFIETWNQVYHPDSTMTDVIVNSDNVGMSFVAMKLGKERLVNYLEKFGIGEKTGVDLQGEMTPLLREMKDWSMVDVATAGFGQGIAVTPIQLIKAVSAIADGGIMLKPRIVTTVIAQGREDPVKRNTGVRVISEEAAKKITMMMVEAAQNGEAKWTNIRGFKVAGKTGTAQIPIAGHYDPEKTNASFIGFAPYDDPKFIMLVALKEPKSSPWASETAAPLWYSIAKDLFFYMGIQPK